MQVDAGEVVELELGIFAGILCLAEGYRVVSPRGSGGASALWQEKGDGMPAIVRARSLRSPGSARDLADGVQPPKPPAAAW